MNEKALQSLFSCYLAISGTVILKIFYSYRCPDYNMLMDAGYQSGTRMNIAVNYLL